MTIVDRYPTPNTPRSDMPSSPLRRLLPLAAAVVASSLALSACAATESSDAGGELLWAIEGANLPAGHMDPQTSQLSSDEHTSELQSLMRTSSAVFCLNTKQAEQPHTSTHSSHLLRH